MELSRGLNILYDRLYKKFGKNEPIFLSEIQDEMKEYAPEYLYYILKEGQRKEIIMKAIKGVYYLPTDTPIGKSVVGVSRIMAKKYLRNGDDVFGIGGRNILDLNFLISTQVPYVYEYISNKESQKVRTYKVKNYTYIIRRSRTTITKDNYTAYTLCELFNCPKGNTFKNNELVWDNIIRYIKDNKITKNQIEKIIEYFPKRSKRNIEESGVYDEMYNKKEEFRKNVKSFTEK